MGAAMGGEIRISPEQVLQVAREFKNASESSEQMVSTLSSRVNSMEGEWAGNTKRQFFQEFQQWERTMREYVQLLDRISMELTATANRFVETDNAPLSGGGNYAGTFARGGAASGPRAE